MLYKKNESTIFNKCLPKRRIMINISCKKSIWKIYIDMFLIAMPMNKIILAAIAAGVLIVGLIFSPIFSAVPLFPAQGQGTGAPKKVTLIADEKIVQIAPDNALHPGGVLYHAMVFNNTIPGPVIAVDQGDEVEVTLINEGNIIHSLDFHAGFGSSKANSGSVAPGENKSWTFKAENAGAFFYHCSADSLNGIWEHVANGMYGGMIVHAPNEKPAKEFIMVFGEIYNSLDKGLFTAPNGTGYFDIQEFLYGSKDLVLTNGMAHKYLPSIGSVSKVTLNQPLADELAAGNLTNFFVVKPGELTRWYIVNAGPNDGVSFHFIGGMIDVRDGYIKNRLGTQVKNDETWWIPPGSATVIEAVFPEAGLYVGVDHALNDVVKGGAFAVIAADSEPAMADDQPVGTCVSAKGSDEPVCGS